MKKERGIALVTILILVLVFSVLGAGMMILSRRDVGESQRNRKSQMALAAAEAGIDWSIYQLEQADTWTGGSQNIGTHPDETSFICSVDTTGLPTNQYAIVCTGTATRVMNVSGGSSSEVRKRLKVLVEVIPPTPETFDDVLYTPCDINGNGRPTLNGDVNASCGLGTVNINGNTSSLGDWIGIDIDRIRSLANSQNRNYTGDVDKSTPRLPLNINGVTSFWNNPPTNTIPNVTLITEDGSGRASFTLTGNERFFGLLVVIDTTPPPPECPPCPGPGANTGNVEFGGTADLEGAVYCTGQYWNHGTPDENGAVICGRARFSGNPSGITYNAGYASELGSYLTSSGSAGSRILSYQDISY